MGLFSWLGQTGPSAPAAGGSAIKRHDKGPTLAQAVEFHHWVFLSGVTANTTSGGIKDQMRQVLAKLDKNLGMAGSDKSRLISATVFLSDMSLRPEMDKIWNAWIYPHAPARVCVGVKLDGGALVEIAGTANN